MKNSYVKPEIYFIEFALDVMTTSGEYEPLAGENFVDGDWMIK
jgi:hypothetical protein